MYYADELRQPESVNGRARVQKAEVEMAKSLVENLNERSSPRTTTTRIARAARPDGGTSRVRRADEEAVQEGKEDG